MTHFGNLHTNYFCCLGLHSLSCVNRGKQLPLIHCRGADETLCISSEVEEPSLKSKRIWDVVSQVFQTIFQLDLVNSYGALHHFVVA